MIHKHKVKIIKCFKKADKQNNCALLICLNNYFVLLKQHAVLNEQDAG